MPGGMEVFEYGNHFDAPRQKRDSTHKERPVDDVVETGNHITYGKANKRTLHKGMKKYKHNSGRNRDT